MALPKLSDIPTDCPLDRSTPFGIDGVTHSMFSVARFYGGANFNGQRYTYNPDTDELIRDDVLKWMKQRKKAKPVALANMKQDALL